MCLMWRISALQVVDRLEATLRVKRFNQLGGLQLDRDVRHMVVTLSEASPCQALGTALPSAKCLSQGPRACRLLCGLHISVCMPESTQESV